MQSKKRVYASGIEEEQEIRNALHQMMQDSSFNTEPTYTANGVTYPEGLIPFVDKHMQYLDANPKLDARMYLANLQLKTRIRS